MIWFRKSSQHGGHTNNNSAAGQDKAQMAFKLYDKDKDGFITKAEMVKLSKNLTKEQVEKVKYDVVVFNVHLDMLVGVLKV